MKKNVIIGILAVTTVIGGILAYRNNKEVKELESNVLNQQNVMATLWQQDSAEVKALRLQAYQQAEENITQLKDSGEMPNNPAVILDIDETVLDNIPAGAYQITSNHGYVPEEFVEWTSKANCDGIEGAAEFINYAKDNGVTVFLVSNRGQEELEATIKNLQAIGIDLPQENILLKGDTSNKQERFDTITNNYNVIMYIGDNVGDFGGEYYKKSNEERSNTIMENKDEIGVKYIALPNPTYGDWEGAIYGYDFSQPNEVKIKIKNEALKPFK